MASPASTTFEIETPLPTPQIEVSGFDFPTESDTEVVQQDYDSLEFGFPEYVLKKYFPLLNIFTEGGF